MASEILVCSRWCVLWYVVVYFFFVKQKTAYEMRISDWSSDVCSSDPTEIGRDDPLRDALRYARERQHAAVEIGRDDEEEDRRRNLRGFEQDAAESLPVERTPHQGDDEAACRADGAGFGRGEESRVDAAEHHVDQRQDRQHLRREVAEGAFVVGLSRLGNPNEPA